MIPLFTQSPSNAQAVSFPGQWDYVRTQLQRNVAQVVAFYRAYAAPLRSNAYLIKVLDSLVTDLHLPLDKFYRAIDAKALGLAAHHGMTSALNKGRAHRGVFASSNNAEFFLAVDDFIDFEDVHARWQDVSAFTCLQHPKSDLNLNLPTPDYYSNESGLVIMLVNIPMLAVQYRAFVLSEETNPQGARTAQQFVEQVLLPNVLPSWVEQAFFNRLVRKVVSDGTSNNLSSRKPPIALVDIHQRLEHVLTLVVRNYQFIDKTFEKILRNTPSLYAKDALDFLQLPDIAETAQVQWLLVTARLKALNFLLAVAGKYAARANQGDLSTFARAFQHDGVAEMMQQQLPFNTALIYRSYYQALRLAAQPSE